MPTLAELRQAAGLTPRELATQAGVQAQVVIGIESGAAQHVPPGDMRRLADALGVDPSTVSEFRPGLGLTAVGQTGAGEAAPTGSPSSGS